MTTQFKGEHLAWGNIGQFLVVLSFGMAILSCISYFFATQDKAPKENTSWLRLGRIAYITNFLAILGVGICLFCILYNHYFEFHYAWSYTSRALPVYFLVSGFWNGQEGGFLLWMFWQAVIGLILIKKAGTWEKPVMTVVAFSQVILTSMILGVEIFGARVGSSPFLLLRNAIAGPIFSNPDYLSFIKDGKGMNPSLQNYWMIIHPPVVFLGFASVVVPFAYAIAGLWQRRYHDWIQPAISYALFGAMLLGTGVMMGAAWAYEALNFGGFWAWDPVENASVFPWLTLVAALHVLIVFKNTKHSFFTAIFLVLISFILVWYSSFLARSGILGETSVHAFTDLGMFWHLVLAIVAFVLISAYFLITRWKELPFSQKDEETYSREFWIFVGSAFLGLSCFHLILVTSIPVWNAMFGTKLAPPLDPVKHYNIIQAAFAVVITLLSGLTQFLKYKKTDVGRFFITNGVFMTLAIVLTALVIYATGLYKLHFVFCLVMVCSIYSIIANANILSESIKGKFKLAGSAIAHLGFGLLLVGALIAAGTHKVVSENTTGEQFSADFAKEQNPRENLLLYKNQPVKMGNYTVTFLGDTTEGLNHYFNVNYKLIDDRGKINEDFTLRPNVQGEGSTSGLSSSPDTKHYLLHDLYTHITMSNLVNTEPQTQDADHGSGENSKKYDPPATYNVSAGDTIHYREGYVIFKGLNKNARVQNIPLDKNDIAVGAQLNIYTHGKAYNAEPVYLIKNNSVFDFPKIIDAAGLKLRLSKIIPEKGQVEITVYQQKESDKKFIVMKAIEFPYIIFLWTGTIIMILGFLISLFRRNQEWKTA
ncbi:cytochrome c biogenesis protein CcsA [Mucilaginibacter robiniae]|uniref:Cytochrome c biogenesis protein CcsA n=1 Tax=Mucilaginibacter robiniae TaxID=2728022 RepID=A0A7L5E0M0_9SPHI|nr:cytochrome c biogenesis protein CcsA [Mucilaginibacter robiniae]QJD95084.1 cytochrome c biogenesis protein CcsA [Mucilaginibacter robiniae]